MRSIKRGTLLGFALTALAVFAVGLPSFQVIGYGGPQGAVGQSEPQLHPKIVNVELKGKKLIVTGENFDAGATIVINGQRLKTRNDADLPGNMLVSKKAGKKIAAGEVVTLQVQNTGGTASGDFAFFPGQVVTLQDGGKGIRLRVGERFLLLLKRDNYTWTPKVENPNILKQVAETPEIVGAQGIFEAVAPGQTKLIADGELPCHKARPACLAPTLGFEVNIVVE